MKITDVAGLKLMAVPTEAVEPNPWNPNKQTDEVFQREKLSIQNNGMVDPITVREIERDGDTVYQLIDGEHRWKACGELGISPIPAVNLGAIDDARAMKLTLLFNDLKGDPEPAKLARVMAELNKANSVEDLALELPYYPAEIDALVKSATFDFEAVFGDKDEKEANGKPADPNQPAPKPPKTGAEERRFVLGSIQGNIPVKLAEALVAEYQESSNAVESNNVEIVLADVLRRLRAARVVTKKKPKTKKAPTDASKAGDRKEAGDRRGTPTPPA